MKRCFKCKKLKPLNEFYTHPQMGDGHLNKCIRCFKRDATAYRYRNLEAIRAYDRERGRNPSPSRLQARAKARKKDSQQRADYIKRVGQELRLRINARSILNVAVKSGKIKRQPCERCGSTYRVHGHHEDYYKPLDVIWLCPICHGKRHREINDAKRESVPF
jgi:hypothetical protein